MTKSTPGAFIFCLVAFAGLIIGLIVFLSESKTEQNRKFRKKRPLPEDGPTVHYHSTFDKSSVVWHKKGSNVNPFIKYNKRDDIFIVKKANIFSIKVVLHFDTHKLPRDSIGAACIVFSDGRRKCKADVFLEGSRGILHIKDKLYARPGFSFSVRIQNHHSVIKAIARNFVEITQSFHSGPEINSTYTRVT